VTSLHEILLVRHGRVSCDHRARIRGTEFGTWVTAYDEASLDPGSIPPHELVARVAAMPCIATSTLRRAIESAALLAAGRSLAGDSIFNEAGIPTRVPSRLRLRPEQWDAITRAAWFLGWADGGESLQAAIRRADSAADRLVSLSLLHGAVTLVGHGMLNTLIGWALRRRGWTGAGSPRAYWGALHMRRQAN
jgi:broad specificity phosphatase PhoE